MDILIVDDSVLLQNRVRDIICESEEKHTIDSAFGIVHALQILNGKKFDVIITDIRMPDGNGLELLTHVRKHQPQIRSIVITNFPYPQYRNKAKELGADCFLCKSDEMDQLLPRLEALGVEN